MTPLLTFAKAGGPNVSIVAEPVFHIGSLPVTNSMLLGFVGYITLIVLSLLLARAVSKGSKKRIVVGAQWVYEMLVNTTVDVLGDKTLARSVAPLAITIFY